MWLNSFRIELTATIRLAAVLMIVLTGGAAFAADGNTKSEEAAVVEEAVVEETYPLETCIVTGAELGSMGEPVVYDYKGREVRFCCAGCVKKFEEDPEAYIEKMDKAIIAVEVQDYPLDACVVSGKELGSMGEPVSRVYKGQEVKFCCAGCIPSFESDPDKYMKKLPPVGGEPAGATHDLKNCGGH